MNEEALAHWGAVTPKEEEKYLREKYIMKNFVISIGAIKPRNKREKGYAGMQGEVIYEYIYIYIYVYIIVAGKPEGK